MTTAQLISIKGRWPQRWRAWRNAIVMAVNEGLRQGLFTLAPSDNHFLPDPGEAHALHQFTTKAVPALMAVAAGERGSVVLRVALWPAPDAAERITSDSAGFDACDAFAFGELRRVGSTAYLEDASRLLRCRAHRIGKLAGIAIEPNGYLDGKPSET